MPIKRLHIQGVRNLAQVAIENCGAVNIFTGSNGSGKTSLLEAIFILARARSFRSSQFNTAINHLLTRCVVFAEMQDGTSIGVMRSRNEQHLFKVNGNPIHSASQLADVLPLQLIDAESFSLLEGGPKVRRQFLDWGVFHVEPEFLFHWRRVQKAIKQRNNLLRQAKAKNAKIIDSELAPWDTELVQCAEKIDVMRARYLRRLAPHFSRLLKHLVELETPELHYRRGWSETLSLDLVLQKDSARDLLHGTTHNGPQRADIDIYIGGRPAETVLSRGQEKLLACALRLAQGILLHEVTGKTCVYLVDDLPAELDLQRRQALCRQLSAMRSQVFVTATDPDSLKDCWPNTADTQWFHVEQGKVGFSTSP